MIDSWYEVRVDGEKVAAFAPSETQGSLEESLEQARNVIETTRDGLYKNKVLRIVECKQNVDSKIVLETFMKEVE